MSSWTFALIYILSLPLAVGYLANLLALIDESRYSYALIRIIGSTSLVFVFLLVTVRQWWMPMLAALLTVTLLHVLAPYIAKKYWLGVDTYSDEPLSPSINENAEKEPR